MSFNTAINQIASLLTQGGSPAAHSQDIAARLIATIEDYYNFRESQRGNSEITDSSANSSAFRRAFSPPESNPGGIAGAAGADGLGAYAWAVGETGQDGVDGVDGSGTTINDYRTYETFTIGGGGIDIEAIKRILADALKGKDGKDGSAKCTKGKFAGQDICSILDQQGTDLGKGRRQLKDLEERVKAIEKQLKDTVDCPP